MYRSKWTSASDLVYYEHNIMWLFKRLRQLVYFTYFECCDYLIATRSCCYTIVKMNVFGQNTVFVYVGTLTSMILLCRMCTRVLTGSFVKCCHILVVNCYVNPSLLCDTAVLCVINWFEMFLLICCPVYWEDILCLQVQQTKICHPAKCMHR